MSKIDKAEIRNFMLELKRKSLEKGYSTEEADYIVSKAPDLVKGFGKDLQKQFPNGQWKTINGARVFLNGGKVVAGLDNFNGMIDNFFKEKKEGESKKDSKPEAKDKIKVKQKSERLSTKDRATVRQLDYLADLLGKSSLGFSHKKWAAWYNKKEIGEAIDAAKNDEEVEIE